jgi:hypothetical protein
LASSEQQRVGDRERLIYIDDAAFKRGNKSEADREEEASDRRFSMLCQN